VHVAIGAFDRRREAIAVDDALSEEEAALEGVEALDEELSDDRRAKEPQRER
jgi:hypothetical protein